MQNIIGLLGGTFDPPHNAHIAMANSFLRLFPNAEVIFIPAGDPYHKQEATRTAAQHRLNMCIQAIGDNPAFSVSDVDIVRDGDTYTFDTVQIMRQFMPDTDLWWIMGEDSLRYIHKWKYANSLLKAVNFAVAKRGDDIDFDEETKIVIENGKKAIEQNQKNGKIIFLDMPKDNISSTQIRKILSEYPFRQPEILKNNLNANVLEYIEKNHLYR